ncbi:hypothetical protein CBM2587_B80261 [Cupriavidus taiwanensis]|uniref:Uncharacterized protein n=1 Tax=Cupriavidus taiwanensis TaxID=164546 RepID=A0A375CBU0_9BURK|nr:hypothetical protein CBM2587_B80261 [Cupriavidus taiwanensis]
MAVSAFKSAQMLNPSHLCAFRTNAAPRSESDSNVEFWL